MWAEERPSYMQSHVNTRGCVRVLLALRPIQTYSHVTVLKQKLSFPEPLLISRHYINQCTYCHG